MVSIDKMASGIVNAVLASPKKSNLISDEGSWIEDSYMDQKKPQNVPKSDVKSFSDKSQSQVSANNSKISFIILKRRLLFLSLIK